MYEELYHIMFNAVTDAIIMIEDGDAHTASDILKKAQQQAEERYINRAGKKTGSCD